MAFINLQSKVKELLYCDSLDYITICLEKGNHITTLYFDIAQKGFVDKEDEPSKILRWISEP
jgi:hypothetical protein